MSNNSHIKIDEALVKLLELKDFGVAYSDAFDVLAFLLDIPYNSVRDNLDKPNNLNSYVDRERFAAAISQVRSNIPIAYITGRKEFYGNEFKVTSDTLIPRADTESLINLVIKHHGQAGGMIYLTDLFTGSGCILVTLLGELSGSTGVGVDISSQALKVATYNANAILGDSGKSIKNYQFDVGDLSVDEVIDSYLSIVSDVTSSEVGVHIITANPPYISNDEYLNSGASLKCEPALALVAEDNGHYFYKKLLCRLAKSAIIKGLCPNRYIYLEIGSTQANYLVQYARGIGLELNIEKDLAGRDRVLWCSL